jgi:hypothetical protein
VSLRGQESNFKGSLEEIAKSILRENNGKMWTSTFVAKLSMSSGLDVDSVLAWLNTQKHAANGVISVVHGRWGGTMLREISDARKLAATVRSLTLRNVYTCKVSKNGVNFRNTGFFNRECVRG